LLRFPPQVVRVVLLIGEPIPLCGHFYQLGSCFTRNGLGKPQTISRELPVEFRTIRHSRRPFVQFPEGPYAMPTAR
jgi:hypothetical protein